MEFELTFENIDCWVIFVHGRKFFYFSSKLLLLFLGYSSQSIFITSVRKLHMNYSRKLYQEFNNINLFLKIIQLSIVSAYEDAKASLLILISLKANGNFALTLSLTMYQCFYYNNHLFTFPSLENELRIIMINAYVQKYTKIEIRNTKIGFLE